MRRFVGCSVLLAALTAPAAARPDPAPLPNPAAPSAALSGPKAVEVGSPIVLNPTGSVAPGGLEFGLAAGPGPAPVLTLHSDDGQTVIGFGTAAAAGTYQFYVVAWGPPPADAKARQAHAFAFWTVRVGQPTPPPGPGPGPSPDPNPIDPDPFAGGAFAGVRGTGPLHVLIVTETSDQTKLPHDQLVILSSAAVRSYLNVHCPKEGPQNWPAWRVWDKDVDPSGEAPVWQKGFAKAKGKPTPYALIGNGKAGYAGPLPKTADDFLALLKRFGGD